MGVKFSTPVTAHFSCCNENRCRGTIKINILRFKNSPRRHKQAERLQEAKNHINVRKKYVDLWFENQLAPKVST